MFNLNIKAWDNSKHEFLFWRKVKSANSAVQVFINDEGTNRKGWIEVFAHPKRYTVCFSLGQVDKNGVLLFSGDLVLNEDKQIGKVVYSQNRAGFIVKYKGKLKYIETSKIKKVGDIFNAKNKVKSVV